MKYLLGAVVVLLACGQSPEFVEQDPVFTEAAAASVTSADLARWNEAHTWGDHAAAAYLSQADYAATPAAAITATDFDNWTAASAWGDHAAAGYLTAEADPQFALSTAASITAVDLAAWNAAASFGNHATQGYLTAEGDPAFAASAAAGISAAAISNWNTAASYGNHATQGYLTTAAYAASPAGGIASTDISSWNTAAGYGDHAAQGYLTSETDPAFSASASAGIVSTDISNWNTAASYGDHGAQGYMTSAAYAASPAAGISSTQINNWNTAAGYGNHAAQGYLTSASDAVSSSATNRVPRWNGTTLVDGSISDTGSQVGIQTTNPTHPLQVRGGEGSQVDQASESWTTGLGNFDPFNQTFTAGSSGLLTRFELLANGCLPSAPYTVTQGASGTGAVLASGTITFVGCNEWSGADLSPSPSVVAGEVYTLTFDLGTNGNLSVLADGTRPYAGGYFFSSGYGVDNYDLAFKTFVQEVASLVVADSGAVGIGVEAPARSLHIKDVLRLEPRATAPASPVLGDLYVSSATNQLMFYNGTAWTAL
ncbi:MAG: hypothetical protein M3Y59_23720 [Myxococcota bacterium]|nr:hypothetical protein [Myxococcota bacterium]